jgi:hypothetical protein
MEETTAEVLVHPAFEWWTFLALVTDPSNQFKHFSVVSKLSSASRIVITDVWLLAETMGLLKDKPLVIVILLDGYHSYREREALLLRAAQTAREVELRIVGDVKAGDIDSAFRWRPLFTQQPEAYRPKEILSRGMGRVSFSRPLAKAVLRHRSELLSAKVIWQLIQAKRVREYFQTKFVYCGHSGLTAMERYRADYGVDRAGLPSDPGENSCESRIVTCWVDGLHRMQGHWTNGIVIRALLRFLALRTLVKQIGSDLFLNIYPEPNINVYQAGALFRKHTFLDFGGSLGDEAIYPRSADLLFLERKVIRFDLRTAAVDLWNLKPNDEAGIEGFLRTYADFVISTLDSGCCAPRKVPACP